MKKNYQKPGMKVVKLQPLSLICDSYVSTISASSVGFEFKGGSSQSARTTENKNVWDEEW